MIEESEFVILKSSEVRTKAVSAGRELEPSGEGETPWVGFEGG